MLAPCDDGVTVGLLHPAADKNEAMTRAANMLNLFTRRISCSTFPMVNLPQNDMIHRIICDSSLCTLFS